MKTLLRSIFLMTVATASMTSAALADDADVIREARDRAEIEALMWRYTRALDTFDPDTYAAVFTADGQFGAGSDSPVRVAAAGRSVDELVNVDGQWLVESSNVAPEDSN